MAAYQGTKLSDGTPLNVAVYKAYRNAGLSHSQALGITAEVGRENSFRADILFGNHTDPAASSNGKKIRNLGMLSWNQGRDNMLEGFLKQNGVMKNGVMEQTQANLNAQARFSVREMKSKRYAGGLKHFFNNPNASPDTYARELGKNYIVWAYGQDTIKAQGGGRKAFDWRANDNRRRGHLNTLSGMLGGNANYQSQPQQPSWQAPSFRPASELKQAPGFTIPEWQSASTLKGAPIEQEFKAPEWQSAELKSVNEMQPVNTFKAPEWHSSTEQEVESQSMFKAPEWNPPIDQEIAQQPSFKPPQFMPAEQLQVSEKLHIPQTPELESQDWQTS